MIVRVQKERDIFTQAGAHLAQVLREVSEAAGPGVVTKDLDTLAYDRIISLGDTPAFLNYRPQPGDKPFPATLCVSVNEELVHGVPSPRVLQEGDIVTFDCGLKHQGLFVDAAVTVGVGKISAQDQDLIDATYRAMQSGLVAARAGCSVSDVGAAIEQTALGRGFMVTPELGGHGIGHHPHEEPFIPNIGEEAFNDVLEEGHVIAIEPIVVSGGDPRIVRADDGFTYKSVDGKRGAHFEHTVIVNKDAPPTILTAL